MFYRNGIKILEHFVGFVTTLFLSLALQYFE